ncbi:P-loop containing nucleoside triphosphate hydrolase protein [Rhizopogon salebrosus TDB-379]|nr:P-loop containing nucleoside triphosphate hydrolase protein [Rhizopogon salebrosus TDB-379]
MSDSSSLAGSEFKAAEDDPVVNQDTQGDIGHEDRMAADAAIEEAAENGPGNTELALDRYLIRYQIWDPDRYFWKPYDPSHIKPIPAREDLHNYFYLDVRYANDQSRQNVVVTNFSQILIDFLRFAIGDNFFEKNPKYPMVDFFTKQKHLKTVLAEVHDVLTSNLAGEALKEKARNMGCPDALHKTEEDARFYFEDVAEHFGLLWCVIEHEFEATAKQIELELSYGYLAYGLLIYYFEPGLKYYAWEGGNLTGFTLRSSGYKTKAYALKGTTTRWDGRRYINEQRTFLIPQYNGTTELSKLPCRIMTYDVRARLIARGRLYASLAGVHYKSYKGHRIVIDQRAFDERGGYVRDMGEDYSDVAEEELDQLPASDDSELKNDGLKAEKIPDVPEEDLDRLPALVYGFELKDKSWRSFHVEEIEDIKFDEKAWDHLVIDEDVKNLIKGLVNVTTNVNTAYHIISDVITGKGGGLIAALHGPPGTGKTLTAEAVAEHLKRPLYIVSSLELSTFPSTLETRLSGILSLATTWDAVVLIDEADVFLEQRSLHELERNALVSVVLKVLEYHRGVLFLTTNRIQTFDEAFLSRFSIAIKYPELTAPARLTIWRKFFELAGCPLWGSDPDGFVKLDGKEPRCYVSLSDLEALAQKPFNGRTIKNLVRTAQALALSANEPLSVDHVKVVVRVQEKFLTEFAQSRS